MALHGYGAHALAAACVVQAAVTLVATYAVKPHPVRPLFSHAGGAEALATGRTVFLTNVVNWLLEQPRPRGDRPRAQHACGRLVQRRLQPRARFPTCCWSARCSPRSSPPAPSCRTSRSGWRRAGCWAWPASLVLLTPASVVFALLSEDLVSLLYGAAWMDVGLGAGAAVPVPAGVGLLGPSDAGAVEHRPQAPGVPAAAADARARGAAPGGARRPTASAGAATVSAIVIFARAVVIVAAALSALDLRWSAVLPVLRPRLGASRPCCARRGARRPARRAGTHLPGRIAVRGRAWPQPRPCCWCSCARIGWGRRRGRAGPHVPAHSACAGPAAPAGRRRRTDAMTARPTGYPALDPARDAGAGRAHRAAFGPRPVAWSSSSCRAARSSAIRSSRGASGASRCW